MFSFGRVRPPSLDSAALGRTRVALRLEDRAPVPAGTVGLLFDQAGRIRRLAPGARVLLAEGETASCFHPGPYRIELLPFAAAPEIGLALTLAVDAADPRVAQQRFDLYLASEVAGELTLAALAAAIEEALRRELAQGNLELPPCTSLDEWNAFRAGFNRLLYTRFGVTVDDCLPVDLGERVDYAQLLRKRQELPASALAAAAAAAAPAPVLDASSLDRQALRRLFLELPSLMCALRMVNPAPGAFCLQRALLQRFDLASLQAGTMPALALAAPGQTLAPDQLQRRARASLAAAATLDEAWGWLARAQGECGAALFDDIERIAANLEHALEARRAVAP